MSTNPTTYASAGIEIQGGPNTVVRISGTKFSDLGTGVVLDNVSSALIEKTESTRVDTLLSSENSDDVRLRNNTMKDTEDD